MAQPPIKDGALALSAVNATALNGAIAGTGINNLVQLDGTAKMPAVDGSALTDLTVVYRGASCYSTTTPFPTVSSGVPTVLDWNNERFDTDTIHDNVTNNSRLVVPAGIIKIRLTSVISWPSNATGYRKVEFLENAGAMVDGNAMIVQNTVSGIVVVQTLISPVFEVVGGDYFEVQVTQNSGGSLNPNIGTGGSTFGMEIIE